MNWIIYQIGTLSLNDKKPNIWRYIITLDGTPVWFIDRNNNEFVDTTTSLNGHLGGETFVMCRTLIGVHDV